MDLQPKKRQKEGGKERKDESQLESTLSVCACACVLMCVRACVSVDLKAEGGPSISEPSQVPISHPFLAPEPNTTSEVCL
mmetsp:Transcript_33646/g.66649  ORF Transcript_33646/g.66649 Transcript_33646/m.66649 type:complete len:80 (+) Transcript_33646:663-902(+)